MMMRSKLVALIGLVVFEFGWVFALLSSPVRPDELYNWSCIAHNIHMLGLCPEATLQCPNSLTRDELKPITLRFFNQHNLPTSYDVSVYVTIEGSLSSNGRARPDLNTQIEIPPKTTGAVVWDVSAEDLLQQAGVTESLVEFTVEFPNTLNIDLLNQPNIRQGTCHIAVSRDDQITSVDPDALLGYRLPQQDMPPILKRSVDTPHLILMGINLLVGSALWFYGNSSNQESVYQQQRRVSIAITIRTALILALSAALLFIIYPIPLETLQQSISEIILFITTAASLLCMAIAGLKMIRRTVSSGTHSSDNKAIT